MVETRQRAGSRGGGGYAALLGAVCQEEEKVCNYLDYWASGRVQGQPSLAVGLCGLRI